MKKCVKEIAKSASRALSALYMKFLDTGGMSFDVYKKLFESVVEPVMFYCAGIWGYKVYSEIESVLNIACRLYLGVSKHAANNASKGDMGWYSAEVKQKLEVVRLCCRLRNLPHNRTVYNIHKYYCTKSKSWEKSI